MENNPLDHVVPYEIDISGYETSTIQAELKPVTSWSSEQREYFLRRMHDVATQLSTAISVETYLITLNGLEPGSDQAHRLHHMSNQLTEEMRNLLHLLRQ